MGPFREGGKYRHNKELCQRLERITTAMRTRLIFYGNVVRMNNQGLTFRVFSTVSIVKATEAKWTRPVSKDLEQLDVG